MIRVIKWSETRPEGAEYRDDGEYVVEILDLAPAYTSAGKYDKYTQDVFDHILKTVDVGGWVTISKKKEK